MGNRFPLPLKTKISSRRCQGREARPRKSNLLGDPRLFVGCFFLFAIATILIFPALSLQAQEPALPLDAYWSQLQATRDVMDQLIEAESEDQLIRATLQAEAARWLNVTAVSLPDGTVMPVDHSFLAAQLRADPPDLARTMALLDTMLASQTAFQPDGQASITSLNDILSRAEFQWAESETQPPWWQEIWRQFLAWLRDLFPQSDGSDDALTIEAVLLNYLLTGLGTLLLIAILIYVLRSLSVSFVSDTALDGNGDGSQVPLTADAALSRAQELSGSGDYRTAVRYLYLSALLSLEEHGLLRYNRSLTNREYLRSVAHLPELAAILREVVEVFDRVWYGYQPLDQSSYNHYAARVAELNRARPSRARAGQS